MGQIKIPMYSHRLMHRKRLTCELHDSYFHSKDIEWAIEILYNSVKTGSQLVWRPVGEKMLGWEQAPSWAVQENENDTRLCPEGLKRSICCSSVRSPTPSHTQTFQIKWEVYFSKTVSLLWLRIYMCLCLHQYYMSIQHFILEKKNIKGRIFSSFWTCW